MKIGILTLPLHTNYGGILQAYALQTILERMEHEVVVIDRPPRKRSLKTGKKPLVYIKRLIKKCVYGKTEKIFLEEYVNKTYPIVSQYTQLFINRYISRIVVNNFSELQEKDFDALIVGSDQVWRPRHFSKIEDAYFDFARQWKIKRIAYAPSFGTEDWEYSPIQTLHCSELLKMFTGVSTREESGVRLCREYFGINAIHVLDPTMLLSVEDYIQIIKASDVSASEGNLLCYILDETEEKRKLVEYISHKKGLSPFRVNSKVENIKVPLEERIQPSVEHWLCGFYDAEFVITDSFHACVFSILFHKPFVVIGNENRGMARFHSLLKTFGLEGRLIANMAQCSDMLLCPIDYTKVEQQLNDLRKISYSYLSNSLL